MHRPRLLASGLAIALFVASGSPLGATEPAAPGFEELAVATQGQPARGEGDLAPGLEIGTLVYRFTITPDEKTRMRLGDAVSTHEGLLRALLEAGSDRTLTRAVMEGPDGDYLVFELDPPGLELTFEKFDGLQNPVSAWFLDRYNQDVLQFETTDAEIHNPHPRLVGLARDRRLHRGMVVLRTDDRDDEISASIQAATDPGEALSLLRTLGSSELFGGALAQVVALLEEAGRRSEVVPLLAEFRAWPALTSTARSEQVAARLAGGESGDRLRSFLQEVGSDEPDRLHQVLVEQAARDFLARGDLDGAATVLGPRAVDAESRVLPTTEAPAYDPRHALVEALLAADRFEDADRQVSAEASLLSTFRRRWCAQGFHQARDWYQEFIGQPEHALLRDGFHESVKWVVASSVESPGSCPDPQP